MFDSCKASIWKTQNKSKWDHEMQNCEAVYLEIMKIKLFCFDSCKALIWKTRQPKCSMPGIPLLFHENIWDTIKIKTRDLAP